LQWRDSIASRCPNCTSVASLLTDTASHFKPRGVCVFDTSAFVVSTWAKSYCRSKTSQAFGARFRVRRNTTLPGAMARARRFVEIAAPAPRTRTAARALESERVRALALTEHLAWLHAKVFAAGREFTSDAWSGSRWRMPLANSFPRSRCET
jgi:hypothetical protein